jgi:hypothetical protein
MPETLTIQFLPEPIPPSNTNLFCMVFEQDQQLKLKDQQILGLVNENRLANLQANMSYPIFFQCICSRLDQPLEPSDHEITFWNTRIYSFFIRKKAQWANCTNWTTIEPNDSFISVGLKPRGEGKGFTFDQIPSIITLTDGQCSYNNTEYTFDVCTYNNSTCQFFCKLKILLRVHVATFFINTNSSSQPPPPNSFDNSSSSSSQPPSSSSQSPNSFDNSSSSSSQPPSSSSQSSHNFGPLESLQSTLLNNLKEGKITLLKDEIEDTCILFVIYRRYALLEYDFILKMKKLAACEQLR